MTLGQCRIHLRRWQRIVVFVGVALFLMSVIYGPYIEYAALQNTNKTVNFIHQVQTSPAAKTSRDAATWEVRMLIAICDKVHCDGPALPKDVARSVTAD